MFKRIISALAQLGIIVVITAALFEVIGPLLLNNADRLGGGLLGVARDYHNRKERKTVQYLPDCAKYDSVLGYTLKPGECSVENREHTTDYKINSIGVRDSEAALTAPEVVVLGDSHTMGWGVAENERFSSVVRQQTGKAVLNAGVSSYGTARELKLLERIDSSNLKTLIIQYCDNDSAENQSLVAGKGQLNVVDEATYNRRTEKHASSTAYYPGKYARVFVSYFLKRLSNKIRSKASNPSASGISDAQQAEYMVYALENNRVTMQGVRVIVFELNDPKTSDGAFIRALKAELSKPEHAALAKHVIPVDVAPSLTSEHFYVLDDHMQPNGHRLIADLLMPVINHKTSF